MKSATNDVYAQAILAARTELALGHVATIVGGPSLTHWRVLRRRAANAHVMARALLDLDARLRAGLRLPRPWHPGRRTSEPELLCLSTVLDRVAARLRALAHHARDQPDPRMPAGLRARYLDTLTTVAATLTEHSTRLRDLVSRHR
ncbi:hypothetical protein [Streptoalloteichus hindustanus]|uniref:Uncharacterized protein n=1 Tax=Streptoalloteichus hindustanus TaxID=2017 RepID=A0A1M5MCA6_STRHI|nr:hypothetical protein [Streptoalloteichus hindustanus]SHG74940.1 hypothetical protein SAMN05444320_11370 [Streptoalloteichus hindustanus]